MKDKVYEMEDDYKEAVVKLQDFIERRDLLAKSFVSQTPKERREAGQTLADMDKQIESTEARLAKEYDAYQKYCKELDEQEEHTKRVAETMQKYYVLVKHRMPEELDKIKKAIFTSWTEEEIQNFYDEAAIIEATRLEEILGEA